MVPNSFHIVSFVIEEYIFVTFCIHRHLVIFTFQVIFLLFVVVTPEDYIY